MGCGCNKNKKTNTNTTGQKGSYAGKVAAKMAPIPTTGFPVNEPKSEPVATPTPETTKSPNLLEKALSLGEAVANHVADGMSKVSKQQMATRLEICNKCPFRSLGTCTKCGCILSVKAGWKTSTCPDERWPKIPE